MREHGRKTDGAKSERQAMNNKSKLLFLIEIVNCHMIIISLVSTKVFITTE